jgi:hypothetical protein
MGHEIPAGASYCVQGHPIALEGMQFAGGGAAGAGGAAGQGAQAYGGSGGGAGYGGAQNAAFGAPPPAPAQPPGYGMGPGPFPPQNARYTPQPMGYTPPPGFAPPPQPGAAPAAPAYAPPAPAAQPAAPAPAPAGAAPGAQAGATTSKILRGFLVSYQTTASGDFWPLHTGRVTVGRSNSGESLDILLADATISSRHAAINIDATTGSLQVEDTGSTNGTFVNDDHVGFNGRRELKDGDRVRFGGYTTIIKVIARPLP